MLPSARAGARPASATADRDTVRVHIQSNKKLDTLFHGRSPLVADDSFSACSSARLAAQPTSPRPAASPQSATILSNLPRRVSLARTPPFHGPRSPEHGSFHCCGIPLSLISFRHFSTSLRRNSANSSGRSPTGVSPTSCRRLTVSGRFRTAIAASCSVLMISRGVFVGTANPCQLLDSVARIA